MKKLMIAATVAMLGIAANAGAYTWGLSSSEIKDANNQYIEGGTAMLFLGTVGYDGSALDFSQATYIASIGQAGDPLWNYGEFDFDADRTHASVDTTDTTVHQAYSLILFDQDNVTDFAKYEGNFYLETGSGNVVQDPTSFVNYADFTSSTAVQAGDWQVASVPEPTSGLLLLLGVAGLALKRKRA